MSKLLALALLLAAPFATACGPNPSPPVAPCVTAFDPGIGGPPPEILILSLSGHGAGLAAALCTSIDDDDNRSCLQDAGDAVEVIRQAFQAAGRMTIEERHFADRLRAPDANGDCVPDRMDQLGLVELVATLVAAIAQWIDGQVAPTRIVMVTHSHGTNWRGIAQALRPDIPIAYLIQLDGVCQNWECEHEDAVRTWAQASGLALGVDIAEPCDDGAQVMGTDQDLKDVAFAQVGFILEGQSTGPPPLRDTEDNVRLDGSQDCIFRRGPGSVLDPMENHSGVHQAGSPAMDWVAMTIATLEAGAGCP